MTTHVIIANEGPGPVEVKCMHKGAEGPEPGMQAPDTVAYTRILVPCAGMVEYVYDSQYLVVREVK